jgi:hypothetical protein
MMTNCTANETYEISPRFRLTVEEAFVEHLTDGDHIRRQMRLVAVQRAESLRMRLFLDRAHTRLSRPLIEI